MTWDLRKAAGNARALRRIPSFFETSEAFLFGLFTGSTATLQYQMIMYEVGRLPIFFPHSPVSQSVSQFECLLSCHCCLPTKNNLTPQRPCSPPSVPHQVLFTQIKNTKPCRATICGGQGVDWAPALKFGKRLVPA